MSKELTALGHTVEMFGCHTSFEGLSLSGVTYINYEKAIQNPTLLTCDVLISSRDKRLLRLRPEARLTVLWVHDIHVGDDWENEVPKFDLIFCLSRWAAKTFRGYYPLVSQEKIIVTRNGIDAALFTSRTLPSANWRLANPRFTYSSSPDRGLDVVTELWPKINNMFGNKAELHVYYGFDNWEKMAASAGGKAKIAYLKSLILGREAQGIFYHGRQPQNVVAASHCESLIWFYPTDFKETFCITALEAQAAGCYVITSNLAALSETASRGFLIPPHNTDDAYKETALSHINWVRHHVELQSKDTTNDNTTAWAQHQTWASLAVEWISLFNSKMTSPLKAVTL